MTEPVLYHIPPSFYSQVARLAMAEAGVTYERRVAAAGPPIFETYEPWYLKLNPGGTVPTLVHGDRVFPDSIAIARYVDATFGGGALIPAGDEEVERWIQALVDIPIRELSYGGAMSAMGSRVNAWRLRNLRKRRDRDSELQEVYQAKIEDIDGFSRMAQDATHVEGLRDQVASVLDEMDATLAKRPWLAGSAHTMADVVWTVGIARFFMLELAPLRGRPALAEWYLRVKERPSFAEADVWEAMQFRKLAPVMARKLLPRALPVILFVALLAGLVFVLYGVATAKPSGGSSLQ